MSGPVRHCGVKPYFATDDGQVRLHLGDCLDVLPTIPDASIDAVVTDPPYSLTFMGRDWDRHDSPAAFQAWCQTWATECLRVLKPGGHLLAFGSPRTYHRLACGIEDAGFEIRDSIHWICGSGFPKGQDIGKSIDKRRDDRAQVLRVTAWLRQARDAAGWSTARMDALFGFNGMSGHWTAIASKAALVPTQEQWAVLRGAMGFDDAEILPLVEALNGRKGEAGESWDERPAAEHESRPGMAESWTGGTGWDGKTARGGGAVLEAAKRWEGWNTQLKPAHEPIIVARKSTGFNTTVANVLEHGTGAINVDACRTALNGESPPTGSGDRRNASTYAQDTWTRTSMANGGSVTPRAGRWPTNLLLTHSPDCAPIGERVIRGDSRAGQEHGTRPGGFGNVGAGGGGERPNGQLYGPETVAVWDCQPGCPVAEMDRQSDGAAKFFPVFGGSTCGDGSTRDASGLLGSTPELPIFKYEAKAPASERPRLADGTAWPTVKPLELMRWLVRLVTPPGGVILDPFCGTGATGEAAIAEGFRCVLIEKDPVAAELAEVRLRKPIQPSLFGEVA